MVQKAIYSLSLCLIGLICFPACALCAQDPAELTRYYRAVAVLQRIDKLAKLENELIPSSIYDQDETESLIHHPDTLYVYQVVADELAQLEDHFPKAKLFGAYARLALGETLQGVELLLDYVGETSDTSNWHYGLIAEKLAGLEDWTSLYIICLEWEEKNNECVQSRATYEWQALMQMGRHEAALLALAKNENCLDWKFPVFTAMSTYSLGQHQQAKKILLDGKKKYPQYAQQMLNLWYKTSPPELQNILGE